MLTAIASCLQDFAWTAKKQVSGYCISSPLHPTEERSHLIRAPSPVSYLQQLTEDFIKRRKRTAQADGNIALLLSFRLLP